MLTEGFQSAFVASVVLAGIGSALELLLMGRPRRAPQEALEAVPVPIQNVPALETEGRLTPAPRESARGS